MSMTETYVRLFYKGMCLLVPMTFVLNEHPGGAEYILQYANQDITSAFEDMNHSADALDLLKTFEEKHGDQPKEIYDAEKYTQNFKDSLSFDRERERLTEVQRWRRRNLFLTLATTLAAAGVAAVAYRRHLQHS